MSLVRVLAKHVVEMDFAQLTPAITEQAKRCVLDCTGNMLGGRYTAKGEAMAKYASRKSDAAEATMIGGNKVSREMAAFANAAMSRMLDLDDGHRFAFGHPGGILVPAALAVGEITGASGRDVIVALVAGYDVYARLGAAINPSSYHERGFDATGVCGSVAVAAVVAKLYKLDAEKTKDAMGIAGLQAGGIIEYQNDGTMGKVLCPGWSTSTGIKAVDLAELGFTGPELIFEGKKGFFQAFANQYDPARLTAGLGETYGIMQNYFKLYACMRGLHCALDAMLSLRATYSLTSDKVKKITVKASTFVDRLNKPHPQTMVGAQCSLPFTIATALKYGLVDEVSLDKGLNNNELSAIEDKIEVIIDDKVQAYVTANPDNWTSVEIEVITTDDQKVSEWATVALGEPEKPLSWQQLEAKFTQLLANTDFAADKDTLVAAIRQLDEHNKIGSFTALLNTKGSKQQ